MKTAAARVVQKEAKKIQVVIFRLRDEEFGVEITSVLEISRMTEISRIPQAPGFVEGVINLRGDVLPVIDLAKQFGLKSQEQLPKTARIVVVRAGSEMVGLIVDEVPEVLRITDDDIQPTPEIIKTKIKRDYVSGVGKLDDRLIIILDLNKVLLPEEWEAVAGMGGE